MAEPTWDVSPYWVLACGFIAWSCGACLLEREVAGNPRSVTLRSGQNKHSPNVPCDNYHQYH